MGDARFVLFYVALTACGSASTAIRSNDVLGDADAAMSDGHLGVTCSPHSALAYPGDELLLRANVRGSSNKSVSWKASGGHVSSDATYTAPQRLGTFTITATAKADGSSADDCTIEVVERPEEPSEPAEGAALSVHTMLGVPGGDGYLLAKEQYVLSYDESHKAPTWVSWQLDATYAGGAIRTQTWRKDSELPREIAQASDADYTNSGYDRGHMCPSGDRTRTLAVNKTTFVLSNAVPQAHNVNSGPWQDFEQYLQDRSLDHEIYIIAGGIYDSHGATIGNDVSVPSATWKVAVLLETLGSGPTDVTANTRVISVLMPNDDDVVAIDDDWHSFRVSVRDIEAQTGLDLLSDVSRRVQRAVETSVDAED